VTKKTYNELRPTIQTGDCILWQGSGIISRAIRLWSKYSHASLVVRFHDKALAERVYLIEALTHGLKLTALSERSRGYKGNVFHLSVPLSHAQRTIILADALHKCSITKGYDYKGLFLNMLGRINHDASNYICSEFVFDEMILCGYVRPRKKTPRPGDLPEWLGGELTQIIVQKQR